MKSYSGARKRPSVCGRSTTKVAATVAPRKRGEGNSLSSSSMKSYFKVPLDKHPKIPPNGCNHVFETCENVRWCSRCAWQGENLNWKIHDEPKRWWQVWK
jgi:hypothetical protein